MVTRGTTPATGVPGGGARDAGPSRGGRCARARRAGIADGEAAGGGGGTRPRVRGGGRVVAGARMLDVHRDERRPAVAGRDVREHEQPELRGAAGTGRAD